MKRGVKYKQLVVDWGQSSSLLTFPSWIPSSTLCMLSMRLHMAPPAVRPALCIIPADEVTWEVGAALDDLSSWRLLGDWLCAF